MAADTLRKAPSGVLADALGGCTDDDERLHALVAELHRRGAGRYAGARFAVILDGGGVLILDRAAIAAAEGEGPPPRPAA